VENNPMDNSLLQPGQKAPDFSAVDENGNPLSLSKLIENGPAVLVFYPADNTPVCTQQLCAFRDSYAQLKPLGITVAGVNPANTARHKQFVEKHSFPFPLIADTGGSIAKAYGCKALLGLIKRTVYVIAKDGRILYAQRGNPAPSEVAEAVKAAG
jgi:thioredoxin-dependent peroxiredoxin